MSVNDAKRALRWSVVMEAMSASHVDPDTIAMVEHARHVDDIVHTMAQTLICGADHDRPKNYVKVEMTGMLPPFDRAYVELVRPGGMTSHELRKLLRDRLIQIRDQLQSGSVTNGYADRMIATLDEDLDKESP